jgi:CheY-like chemotaxis protein
VQLDGVRVLVVDDHEDTLDLERMVLSSEGADVRIARSVAEALAALLDFPADVVVTDISMPERDGFEMLRQLRLVAGRTGRTPAIVTTAHAEEVMRAAASEAGFALFVAKPAEPSALVGAVLNVVGNRRGRPKD